MRIWGICMIAKVGTVSHLYEGVVQPDCTVPVWEGDVAVKKKRVCEAVHPSGVGAKEFRVTSTVRAISSINLRRLN